MTDRLWILGAPDPEMESIETLLLAAGERITYARVGVARVWGGNAYAADPVRLQDEGRAWVECGPRGGRHWADFVVDHHRRGDPGYGRPPAEFLPASSIGQVVSFLAREDILPGRHGDPFTTLPPGRPGEFRWAYSWFVWTESGWWRAPADLLFVAAADHCLAAAYRRECPSVDPKELGHWRIQCRAEYQRRTTTAVLSDVQRAQAALATASRIKLGGVLVADVRGPVVRELPEASARDGVAFVGGPMRSKDGREQYVLQSAPAAAVEAWLRREGPAADLVDLYGDPARGMAGGYAAGGMRPPRRRRARAAYVRDGAP